ncbi:TolC family outer membrane protein [Candidatus Woesearchaeota archaeon]|nr:TolC family outer membrane protein [Candidatus Woesearchaeota archaeon]
MLRRTTTGICLSAGLFLAQPLAAMDLLESYQLALQSEPNFLAARAAADATREAVPQARSQLLPSVQATGSVGMASTERTSPSLSGQEVTNSFDYMSSSYGVNLRQPLFRMQNWALLRQAKEQVAGADATLQKETQNLGDRVASAYFNGLYATDSLASVLAQKEAYQNQLNAATRQFELGQGTRTDIDEAQARYDLSTAQEIEERQNVDYTRHQIERLTNQAVDHLSRLNPARMDLKSLEPAKLEDWISRAEASNPEIKALKHGLASARQEVNKAAAGHYPTLDIYAQYSHSSSDANFTINQQFDTTQVGVQMALPIFNGGYVDSRIRQALATVQQAEQQLEAAHVTLQLNVRRQFQSIVEGVAKIRAMEKALYSAEQSLVSNRKGYEAGIRSSIEVLNAVMEKAKVENDLARTRYEYALARLRLRSLTGELDQDVIAAMNTWFGT